jgi:antitoxin (DNA-binding transcriptional repressor) of toxin-antitoxin stability system
MPKKIGVAEVKKQFSTVISEVSLKGEHFIIEKKGKPMAAMVSVKELGMIESSKMKEKRKGLLAAISAWEDFDDLEKMVMSIYEGRRKAKERGVGRLA